jgi:hypothetical protein
MGNDELYGNNSIPESTPDNRKYHEHEEQELVFKWECSILYTHPYDIFQRKPTPRFFNVHAAYVIFI